MILYRSNYKSGHSSLTLDEWFVSGTSLQIDHHCISLWIPDMKQTDETTNASGSRVPQNTLHLRQKTGEHNQCNLLDFLSLKHIFLNRNSGGGISTKIWPSMDIFHSLRLKSWLFNTTLLCLKVVNRKMLQCWRAHSSNPGLEEGTEKWRFQVTWLPTWILLVWVTQINSPFKLTRFPDSAEAQQVLGAKVLCDVSTEHWGIQMALLETSGCSFFTILKEFITATVKSNVKRLR